MNEQETRGERVTYPAERERIVLRAEYEQMQKRAEEAEARLKIVDENWAILHARQRERATEAEARATELLKPISADDLADASSILRDEWYRLLLSLLRLKRERDEAQAHAAKLAEVCEQLIAYRDRAGAINWQLEKADDYHRMIRAALSATPAASLAYLRALEETLESFIQIPDAMREIMRQNGLTIDNLDDPMQKLALTFYSEIVGVAQHALATVEA